MIAERVLIDLLKPLGPTWYGAAPQPPDGAPSPLPCIIVNRVASLWSNAFCGTDPNLSRVSVQVDYYAETAEASRRLADQGRRAIIAAGEVPPPGLQSEVTLYDEMSRAWRILQVWSVHDYAPAL